MRRHLVLTNEAARHPFRQTLPHQRVEVSPVREPLSDRGLFLLAFTSAFLAFLRFSGLTRKGNCQILRKDFTRAGQAGGSNSILRVTARDTTDRVDSDDALMARVEQRDPVAFRVLVDRHVTMLHRIAYRMIGDASEAEDLAQESLLRLWRDAGRWQPGLSGTGAWLSRVTVNLCLDRLRKRRFSSDAEVPEREDEAPRAPETIDAERKRAATVAAIAALPDRQRAAIVLTYYEDQANQIAAEAMDMNIKAFESLLLRARSALRVALLPIKEATE